MERQVSIIEKIQDLKIITEMMKDCFLPKQIYIMELDDCLESFRDEKEYSWQASLDNWEFTWLRVEKGLYVLKSFYRPVAVRDLMEDMMRGRSFDGTLRLWNLPEKKQPLVYSY